MSKRIILLTYLFSLILVKTYAENSDDTVKVYRVLCEFQRQKIQLSDKFCQMYVKGNHFGIYELEDINDLNMKSIIINNEGIFLIIYNSSNTDSLIKKIANIEINSKDSFEFNNIFENIVDYKAHSYSLNYRSNDTIIDGIGCYKIINENKSTSGLTLTEICISKKKLIPVMIHCVNYREFPKKYLEIIYMF